MDPKFEDLNAALDSFDAIELDSDDVFRNVIFKEFRKLMEVKYSNGQVHIFPKNDVVYEYEFETQAGKDIAQIMRDLNVEGMTNNLVGNPKGCDHGSFKSVLSEILEKFLKKLKELNILTICYVELGGEPIKTDHILKTIRAGGIEVANYICVDINKYVAIQMKEFMTAEFREMTTTFITSKWDEFRVQDHCSDPILPALFTNLGWQETMFEADFILSMLKGIMRPTDYLLSELQVIPDPKIRDHEYDMTSILDFYQLSKFRRFSDITLQSNYPGAIDNGRMYETLLFPVCYKGEIVYIAMTTEVLKLCKECAHDDQIHIFVTWYNIKYGIQQWSKIKSEYFDVIIQTRTADSTILFEIASPVIAM